MTKTNKSMTEKVKSFFRFGAIPTVFDDHKISDSEQYLLERQNKFQEKAFDKFMTKQQNKPRARYLKKLRYGEAK